jgi:hypothetical protein
MSGLHKAKKTKKHRKHGRNSAYCLRYKNENREGKNKIKKLVRHLSKFLNDNCAKVALGNTKTLLGLK